VQKAPSEDERAERLLVKLEQCTSMTEIYDALRTAGQSEIVELIC